MASMRGPRTRRYHVPPPAARTISALVTLRDHLIAPILAGVRSPAWDVNPKSGPSPAWRPAATAADTGWRSANRAAKPSSYHKYGP